MDIQSNSRLIIWKTAPFFRLIIPLIAGVLMEETFPVNIISTFSVFLISLCLAFFLTCIPSAWLIRFGWVTGLSLQVCFYFLGRVLIQIHRDVQIEQTAVYSFHKNSLVAVLTGRPVLKGKSYKCEAEIRWIIHNDSCFHESEKIFIYFSNNTDVSRLPEGAVLLTGKQPGPIENFKNTTGFNYRRYCRLRHIYGQIRLGDADFSVLGQIKTNVFKHLLAELRDKIRADIKRFIPGRPEAGLLEALMVGFTGELDAELLKSYADAGVIHIIAISGLHLALICHILQVLFAKIPGKKTGNRVRWALTVSCLWAYSILSGASPSVIRAAAMSSLILYAKNICRQPSVYNMLAASAFFLLCFDPNWIWDTGFQLSYAAVLSLCLFYEPVKGLLACQNKLLALIWDAMAVSIAAQILTTPVSIFYFHRFPSYFLFANLPAVPLSSLILLAGILVCISGFVYDAGVWLGRITGWLIHLLNHLVLYISRLPGAVLDNLRLSLPELIVSYLIILCFYKLFTSRSKFWLKAGLGAICIFRFLRLFSAACFAGLMYCCNFAALQATSYKLPV